MLKRRILLSLAGLLLVFVFSPFAQQNNYTNLQSIDDLYNYLTWSESAPTLVSAHRGGPLPGYPENSLEAFENSLQFAPCIIECDVRKSSDGKLLMMHDWSLNRTTNDTGSVYERDWQHLSGLILKDNDGNLTDYKIPLFSEVLNWTKGKAILTIDVKKGVEYSEIIKEVRDAEAEAYSVIICYSADAVKEVHTLAPDLMISVPGGSFEAIEKMQEYEIPYNRMIAFCGVREPDPKIIEFWHSNGVMTIVGTMGNLDRSAEVKGSVVYSKLYDSGADVLATDNVPLASEAANKR